MAEFLRALGWFESPESEPAHRLFQGTNGIVVALYGTHNYEPHFGARTDGFRGFTLGLNVATPEEVDRVYETLQGPKRLITFPGGHFQAYDRYFKETSEPAREWFLLHHKSP